MATKEHADPYCLSSADVARELGCAQWQIARICEKKLYPDPPRIGRQRAFRRGELPAIRTALIAAGYLKAVEGA